MNADHLAQLLLRAISNELMDHDFQPRVDVESLAVRLGVTRIEPVAGLPRSGQLMDHENDVWIQVKREMPIVRRRFTIAHELGHHLLATRLGVPKRDQLQRPDIEATCDFFAGRVLVPRSWIFEDLRTIEPSLTLITESARSAGVSAQVMLIQLNRSIWSNRFQMVIWKHDSHDGWWQSSNVGPLTRELTQAAKTEAILEGTHQGRPVKRRLPLSLYGHAVEVAAELEVGQGFARAFFDARPIVRWLRKRSRRPTGSGSPEIKAGSLLQKFDSPATSFSTRSPDLLPALQPND